jgi:hypothetical protein
MCIEFEGSSDRDERYSPRLDEQPSASAAGGRKPINRRTINRRNCHKEDLDDLCNGCDARRRRIQLRSGTDFGGGQPGPGRDPGRVPGQSYNQANATRSPDKAPGACYRERAIERKAFYALPAPGGPAQSFKLEALLTRARRQRRYIGVRAYRHISISCRCDIAAA